VCTTEGALLSNWRTLDSVSLSPGHESYSSASSRPSGRSFPLPVNVAWMKRSVIRDQLRTRLRSIPATLKCF